MAGAAAVGASRMASQLAAPGAAAAHTGAGVHVTPAGEWSGTSGAGVGDDAREEAAGDAGAAAVGVTSVAAAVEAAGAARAAEANDDGGAPEETAPSRARTAKMATLERAKALTAARRDEGKLPTGISVPQPRVARQRGPGFSNRWHRSCVLSVIVRYLSAGGGSRLRYRLQGPTRPPAVSKTERAVQQAARGAAPSGLNRCRDAKP